MPANLQINTLLRGVLLAVAVSLLAGCITINIYFPSAAAEKAADKVIDEVWQLQGQAPGASSPANSGQPAAETAVPAEPAK